MYVRQFGNPPAQYNIVGQTNLKPKTHLIKITSRNLFMSKGKGKVHYFGIQWSSWERILGAGKRSEAMGLRRKDLAAICRALNARMNCIANSVVAALMNKRYYSSRR